MEEEIKEILDNFEKYEARYILHNETQFIITHREIQILLYYITNLQEENERLNENNQAMQEEMARTWKIADNYKSRCEKAIEYIKTKEVDFVDEHYQQQDDYFDGLLNILNGGENND